MLRWGYFPMPWQYNCIMDWQMNIAGCKLEAVRSAAALGMYAG